MKWHNINHRKPSALAYILVSNGTQIGITRYRDIRSATDSDDNKRISLYDDEGVNSFMPLGITHWTYVSTALADINDFIIIDSAEITD